MNSILTMDADEGKVSFIIPYIVFVNQKENHVEVILNCPAPKSVYNINFPGKLEAEGAYLKIISIIGSYYDAIMPNNSGCSCKDK